MDQVANLEKWKTLLFNLKSTDSKVKEKAIEDMINLFEHLSPQTAVRHQKEYESCTLKSEQILGDLFDDIDLSDKTLLCSLLEALGSFGFFRLAQITYYIGKTRDDLDPDPIYFPIIEKAKWYDMCPLLPKAGTIGWKGIMNHGLVKDEHMLLQACLKLLSLKLHFYSIIFLMEQFQDYSTTIKRNGVKVAEKLLELIRDVAYDDQCIIGLDSSLFNLLSPFMNEDQQASIIDATVQDLFKPYVIQKPIGAGGLDGIYQLINKCIMNKAHSQDLLTAKLIEHLKCNLIRRKRRHSVENLRDDDSITLESLLNCINNGEKLQDLLPKVDHLDLSAKSLQTNYLSYWIDVLNKILPLKTITAVSSLKIIATCSILLASIAQFVCQDLINELSILLAKTIDNTGQGRLDKLFLSCSPPFLVDLTKILSENTQVLSKFDSPMQQIYKSYLSRYLRCCVMRSAKLDASIFIQFITFICDKNLDKDTSHLLQYICLREILSCMDSFHNRLSSKIIEMYLGWARTCSKKIYKFVKRNLRLEINLDEEVEVNDVEQQSVEAKKFVVVDALICIMKIAIERKEQEMLDTYGDLILKIFGAMIARTEKLIETTQTGVSAPPSPLDPHLSKLLNLFVEHKDMIRAYLNYDLVETLSSLLIIDGSIQVNGLSDGQLKSNRKAIYTQIKTKLEDFDKRVNNSLDVYQTIINKQYSSVVEMSIGSTVDIKQEKSCCHGYWRQMKAMSEVTSIISRNCNPDIFKKILNSTVNCLEQCDPLDHSRTLYFFVILESLMLNLHVQIKNFPQSNSFKEVLPKISCSLIRLAKSVELGPSIHAFSRPGSHKSNRGIQCCTYANCIKIYTLIFMNFPARETNPFITDAMQICVSSNLIQYAKYSSRLHSFFIQLASAIAGLLKSICIGRKEETLKSSMPIFLSVFSHLIRSLVMASDRQKLQVLPELQMNGHGNTNNVDENMDIDATRKDYETQLELLALDIGRTLNNLSLLKIKMVDYAPHLISSYVKDIQRASCPDFVRLHLNEGIFRIFNLIDAHQKERQEEIKEAGIQRKTFAGRAAGSLLDMIHARLDQASREIFRDMHDNYNRFHRYIGKC